MLQGNKNFFQISAVRTGRVRAYMDATPLDQTVKVGSHGLTSGVMCYLKTAKRMTYFFRFKHEVLKNLTPKSVDRPNSPGGYFTRFFSGPTRVQLLNFSFTILTEKVTPLVYL